ncbi:MAG: DUF3368 domain-containing protein [Crocosphaera sp.]
MLGILLIAKKRGLIPAFKPVIDALINDAGFRVSRLLYEEILKSSNESY